jgi:hypothetical protein
MRRGRIGHAQHAVMRLLSDGDGERRISYDDMSVLTGYDRRTIICAVKQLRHQGMLHVAEQGRGATPNRYVVGAIE